MASQSVMSTPIFDELLREMRAVGGEGTAEQPKGETAPPPQEPQAGAPQPQQPKLPEPTQPGGRRRRGSD